MLSSRDLFLAECPRHGSLQCAPSRLRKCGATASLFSQDLRSAQQHGQARHSVSQQPAKRQNARTHNLEGQHCAEASATQQHRGSKTPRHCLPNAVIDLQASTSNGADAAMPTEQGQPQGTRISSSQPQSRDSNAHLHACKGTQKPSAQLAVWCWEWANTRWRASFFFLMASVAFVIGSGASLQPHVFAGRRRSIHTCSNDNHCYRLQVCHFLLQTHGMKGPGTLVCTLQQAAFLIFSRTSDTAWYGLQETGCWEDC